MGFYAPAQVVRDARDHGVEVRPACVQASRWDCTLEPSRGRRLAVRLGLRMVQGLSNAEAARLVAHRGEAPCGSVEEVRQRSRLSRAALERLAEADAFRALGLDRRAALWAVRGLAEAALPLFAAADRQPAPEGVEPAVALAPLPAGGEVVEDYRSLGLSLRQHPLAFLRGELEARRMLACGDLATTRDGRRVALAGLVLVRQKPGSAKGVMFVTVEDETGVANLILRPGTFERQRRVVLQAGLLACHGRVQREGEVVHLVADRLEDLTDLLHGVARRGDAATPPDAPDVAAHDPRPRASIRVPTREFR